MSRLNVVLHYVAMGVMVYALWTYHWRAASIRHGGRGPYDDRVGPVRLSFYLIRFKSLTRNASSTDGPVRGLAR